MENKNQNKKRFKIGKKRNDGSKFIELNPTMNEAKNLKAVITFGRFSPPTIGHEKLAKKVVSEAKSRNATPMIFASHSFDKKKNPLSYNSKINYLQKAFGDIVKKTKSRTIIEIAKELSNKFDHLIVVVGSDRIQEFQKLLNTYNGREYNFDTIEVISAGERDPDADDVSGMSASKLRSFAAEGNLEEFKKGLPNKIKSMAKEIYSEIRMNMGIREELETDEILEQKQPLTIQQRRDRARTMRRYRSRIAAARKRARRRKAPPEKLKQRARRRAREIIRQRFLQGKSYGDLSPAEKVQVDKRVLRIPDNVISRIATRQLPKVRQAEMERLSQMHGGQKTESINERFENFLLEKSDSHPYHRGVAPSTADKRRTHFKKGAEKDPSDPSAYKPAPGDATAETKPSKHTKRYHKLFKKEGIINHDKRFKFYRKKENPYFKEEIIIENEQALRKKASETGISYGILKKVFDRGVAAWRTGHRPGTTPSQWGFARVNSFATGGKTRQTADADLWKQHSGKKNEEFFRDAIRLMENVDKIINKNNPSNREQGTDSLVKIYKNDTPGQYAKNEAYYSNNIPEFSFHDFERGSRVRFSSHSMDMFDNGETKEGTIVGSTVSYLRVRDDDGILYKVRHADAKLIEATISGGFEGKRVVVKNKPIRMVDGTMKKMPPAKSASSKGGNGD